MMIGCSDLDVRDCIEIADACFASGKAELIPQFLRNGVHPKEVKRRLAILGAPPEHPHSMCELAELEAASAKRFGR
jgi:hypothetical protein